jgi:ribose 5-phosphate isomerase A
MNARLRAGIRLLGRPDLDQDEKKRLVARESLGFIEDGMRLGVGTGSTVDFLIEELARHAHRLSAVVSSSQRSTEKLGRLGIAVSPLTEVGEIDLYIDGADEATKQLHLIKGGGGALTREKVLAGASRKFVCIVDESKLVGMLGRFPLPIEVVPMAHTFVARQLFKAGGQPALREDCITDNGNYIIDVHRLAILNPREVETRLNQIPGVVTVGIFANRAADVLLIGDSNGVRTMR